MKYLWDKTVGIDMSWIERVIQDKETSEEIISFLKLKCNFTQISQ